MARGGGLARPWRSKCWDVGGGPDAEPRQAMDRGRSFRGMMVGVAVVGRVDGRVVAVMDIGGRHIGEKPSSGWGVSELGRPRQSMVARRCTPRCTDMLVGSTQRQGSTGQVE